jgi:hypothetical protein
MRHIKLIGLSQLKLIGLSQQPEMPAIIKSCELFAPCPILAPHTYVGEMIQLNSFLDIGQFNR